MLKQFIKGGKKNLAKKKQKRKSRKQLELQYQLKEFLKLQRETFSEQPILSIREYERKKRILKKPAQRGRRVLK